MLLSGPAPTSRSTRWRLRLCSGVRCLTPATAARRIAKIWKEGSRSAGPARYGDV